jgi:hypothetical protein
MIDYTDEAGSVEDRPFASPGDGDGVEIKLPTKAERRRIVERFTYASIIKLFPSLAGRKKEEVSQAVAMARAIVADLMSVRPAIHIAPTGSGKSYASRLAAAYLYRMGLRVAIAVPTLILADEVDADLQRLIPKAFEDGAVAVICGRRHPGLGAGPDDEPCSDGGGFNIGKTIRIVVLSHAQLGRRGWSKFAASAMKAMGKRKRKSAFQPFYLIVDEVSDLIAQSRLAIDLSHRVSERYAPDGSYSLLIPRSECPKHAGAGNCANCSLMEYGGSPHYNEYNYRELKPPAVIKKDSTGHQLTRPFTPLRVRIGSGGLETSQFVQVGESTWASKVTGYQGTEVKDGGWRGYRVQYFEGNREGVHPHHPETNKEVLKSILRVAWRAVVLYESPADDEGMPLKPDELRRRIENEEEDWDKGVTFPKDPCWAPTLRLTDLLALASIRQYTEEYGTAVSFLGATMIADDREILEEVFPAIKVTTHPYPTRRIKSLALVSIPWRRGPGSLIGEDGRLVTAPLEYLGTALVFCATKKKARGLYREVRSRHASCYFAIENDKEIFLNEHITAQQDCKTAVTYTRGVLGKGVNLKDVRTLIVDVNAFRPISSFTPGELTIEEFERARTRERCALMIQNVGRVLRGEKGKTACVVLLNADDEFVKELMASPSIQEGCEEPALRPAAGGDIEQVMDQCRRWLDAGGGDWPPPDASIKKAKKKPGPRKGQTTKSLELTLASAQEAAARGDTWRQFARAHHPERYLSGKDLELVRACFPGRGRASGATAGDQFAVLGNDGDGG